MISAMNFILVLCVALFCLAGKVFSGTLPEYVCVKAASNAADNNLPSNNRDDKIKIGMRVPILSYWDLENKQYAFAQGHILGLHDDAYCWNVQEAIDKGLEIAAVAYNPKGEDELACYQGLYLDVKKGKDCYIGPSCDSIEAGKVQFFMIDRQPGNVVDYWWCRKYNCPLVTDDSLPEDLQSMFSASNNTVGEEDSCYEGLSYSQYAAIAWGVSAVVVLTVTYMISACIIYKTRACAYQKKI